VLDRRTPRRRTLTHEYDRHSRILGSGEQAGHIATRPVEVRLDDVKHESPSHRRIEGVTAPFEHGLGGCRGQPVRDAAMPKVPCRVGRVVKGSGGVNVMILRG
jgi:hypothetical protein